MGYGLVVSRETITGARKPDEMEEFEAYLPKGVSQEVLESAARVAEELAAHREFEVSTGEIGQVLIRAPTLLSGGFFIVKAPMQSFRVDTAVLSTQSPLIFETFEKTARMMFEAVGERLYDGSTGMPYETLQQLQSSGRPRRIL